MNRRDTNTVVFLLVADVVITLISFHTAVQLRYWLPWGVKLSWHEVAQPWTIYLLITIIWVPTFVLTRVYDEKRSIDALEESQLVIFAVAVACLLFAGVLYLTFRELPRRLFLYFAVGDLALLLGFRLALRLALRFAGRREPAQRRVLVVGAGQLGRRLASTIEAQRTTGLVLVGYVDDDPAKQGKVLQGAPVLGKVADTPALVQAYGVEEVIFALPLRAHGAIEQLVLALQELPVRVRIVPDFLHLAMSRATVEDFDGLPLVGLRDPAIDGLDRIVKRVFDLSIASALLLLTWPFMLLIALAIKLDSPGPAIFVQERVGENGRLFKMYKFRSMVADAEQRAHEVIRVDANGDVLHKHPDDPRVTRVGRFLRRTSLDELPQLFNVLRGEMSLVGPRPELPWLVAQYESWQRRRFAVPPGITGWWQINGRSERAMHLHTEDDLYYIQNYSPLLDLQILWRTVGVVLRGRGAF
ncbi:MAG: undecaprenyl-phosphate glucose phosphotransferase [Caldilineales bacterium]|nr:undecaprenyl-phosphate glucose phosphotransferase [Caldilineales bacterium]MDW8318338.1 undecaprenyl-phosphate glucose phosphotransferase [Anaerolineae bacterium]